MYVCIIIIVLDPASLFNIFGRGVKGSKSHPSVACLIYKYVMISPDLLLLAR